MTPQELKTSILQLAFQGKLVEQRLEDGSADNLIQTINKQKGAKQLKKEQATRQIDEDELPFEIPENWAWVHLNEIAETSLGKTLDKLKNTGTMQPYLCSINVYWNGIDLSKVKEAKFEDSEKEKYLLRRGDLLICEGGDVGRSAIWYYDEEMYYQNALHRVRFYNDIVPEFYKYLLECYKGMGIIDRYSKGVTIKHLVQNALYAMWLPFPPLAEQKRIVAKIEELLPYIDRYEKAWSKLEDFNKRFPVDMQKSILQMAIQGKLVEQRPEEGTGEELYQQIKAENVKEENSKPKRKGKKSAVEETEEEPPFDIPQTWKWAKLGNLGYTNIGLTYSPKDISQDGTIVLRSSNIQGGKMDYADIVRVKADIPQNKMCHIGDILICARNGSKRLVGKAAIIDQEGMSFGAFMAIFRSICNPYILHVINSAYFRNTLLGDTGTTTINQITQDMLRNVLFPLPPLAEQKRIVAKLEEILPLCERLK